MTNKLALVVDDSRVARMMLCKLLQSFGFSVVEQGSADEAWAWLETMEQMPLVIFMDLMMPGMDGLTATRRIKNDSRWSATPVVLCTSNDSEADKLSAHDSGVLALLSKPPEVQQLQTILKALYSSEDVVEEKRQPVVAPSIDEVVAQVEQQLWPSWTQQAQRSAEQISQQSTEHIARQLIDEKINGLTKQLSVDLTQQISADVQNKVDQQLATQSIQMQTVLSEKAADAAETAMQSLNQSDHWQQQVAAQTEQWLAHQQQIIQQQLMAALQPKMENVIAEQLAELTNPTESMIETLQEELSQLYLIQQQLQRRQRITNAVLMVALTAGILALLQINLF